MHKRRNTLLIVTGVLLVAITLALVSVSNSIGENVPPTNILPTVEHHAGATAQCRDGYFSYATHPQGQCSSHGGVQIRLN